MARSGRWRRARDTSSGATGPDEGTSDGTGDGAEAAAPTRTATPAPATASSTTASPTGAGAATVTEPAGATVVDEPAVDEPTADGPTHEPADETEPFRLGQTTPVLLLRAAHPRQTILTAVGVTIAAALSGRPGRELLLVLVTVLVGQALLGWFNDLVDRRRDAHHQPSDKPLVGGRLDPGTVWFSLTVAVFAVVPLSVASGTHAGVAYLISLAVAIAGTWTIGLRRGFFSWVPWAVSFGLIPAYLSYGGWGGRFDGQPPTVAMVGLAALLGIGVHVLTSLWGLVDDHADGWTYLPLRLGLRLGASRLLWVTVAYLVLVVAAMALVGASQGLGQTPA